jgi:Ca2+-binding RTX toxin-like protein
MANIIGTNKNDTLGGTKSADTITANKGNDSLTGGGSKDTFVYNLGDGTDTITDFGGVGKGTTPTAAVIAEVDTIKFIGAGFTARNLLLTQNGTNLEITFEGVADAKVILKNFKLENLENLKASGGTPAIGNILFNGQTSIIDSFNVLDANSTDTSIGIKNTVTFLNDLNNNITGLDKSDDVINGQGGNDKIDGLSGNDLLRGGTGNDTLIGGLGNDTLVDDSGNNSLVGGIGDDILNVDSSTGNNSLVGGIGDDILNVNYSTGNNLLDGGGGNDFLTASGDYNGYAVYIPGSSGKNTLNGGAGDDYLSIDYSTGDNLLDGGDGNDTLSASDFNNADSSSYGAEYFPYTGSSGNNILKGGAGNDRLIADYSAGDNLLDGGDGNDLLSADGSNDSYGSDSKNTLNGGAGDDDLSVNNSKGDNLLNGGDGNDILWASGYSYRGYEPASGNNTLNGGTGSDYLNIDYSSGNNLLDGGDGNDILSAFSASGNNLLSGDDGNDSFYLSPSSPDTAPSYLVTQTVDGGKDDDLLSIDYTYATGGISSTFNATTNIGSITAGIYRVSYKNIERLNISGTAYNDNIVGSNGNDTLSTGYGGKDTIDGGNGDDILSANYTDATGGITTTFNATTNVGSITAGTYGVSYKNIERLNISGTAYNDNIVGRSGNDTLSTGYGGKDTIDGGNGDDILSADYSNATGGITTTFNATTNVGSITAGTYGVSYKNIERLNISGTAYNDNIVGSSGNDTLSTGYRGKDTIDGGNGDDYLSASSSGNNLLSGGDGNDYLTGGYGNDNLIGGTGNDIFAFNNFNEGLDTIYDFNATNEVIQVSANYFGGGLSIGSLKANQFTIGTSATTSTQRFIYNSGTGALFFDQDGSAGAFSKVQFAQLSTGLSLTNNNFVVV